MKTMKHYLWMFSILLCGAFVFISCNEDEQIGNYINGHWFGDMDMWIDGEKSRGSEIEFIPDGWGYSYGHGIEVDYYYYGSITHYFDYRIKDGIVYMTFDDPNLDCAIVDYRLTSTNFSGWIADYYTLENMTHFNLRNYDRYWDDYGYGRYYVKAERDWDEDTNNTQKEAPKCIRGVNMKKVKE